jgi:hypothetical protein
MTTSPKADEICLENRFFITAIFIAIQFLKMSNHDEQLHFVVSFRQTRMNAGVQNLETEMSRANVFQAQNVPFCSENIGRHRRHPNPIGFHHFSSSDGNFRWEFPIFRYQIHFASLKNEGMGALSGERNHRRSQRFEDEGCQGQIWRERTRWWG